MIRSLIELNHLVDVSVVAPCLLSTIIMLINHYVMKLPLRWIYTKYVQYRLPTNPEQLKITCLYDLD